MTLPRWTWPLGLALLLTAANVAKPLVIDDTAYVLFARQIAEHPDDPYGFSLLWYHQSQPAFTVLAPPLVPYWVALEMRLFGENPILWKLGLFPFAWLLCGSVVALTRRIAPSFLNHLSAMAILSPVVLPGFNLMLDIPALALMLAGVVLFLRSVERSDVRLAILSGLLLGLAMQTKYTALLGPPIVLWAGFAFHRIRYGILGSTVACIVFASWELFLLSRYGDSHFLFHLTGQGGDDLLDSLWQRVTLTGRLLAYLGGLAQGLGLLAWAATRCHGVWFRILFVGSLVGLPMIILLPPSWNPIETSISAIVLGTQSLVIVGGLLWVWVKLLRRASTPLDWFLLGWFVLEVLGFYALTPFGAARRILELVTVGVLLSGRLSELSIPATDSLHRGRVRLAVWVGIVLGCFYTTIDFIDAYPEKWAARRSAEWIRTHSSSDESTWFVGHWGFRYDAESEGMRPILPEESIVPAGSWVVLPDNDLAPRPTGQAIVADPEYLEPMATMTWSVPIGVSTNPTYYGGQAPLVRQFGPRCAVVIYRVRKEWRPRSPPGIRIPGPHDSGS